MRLQDLPKAMQSTALAIAGVPRPKAKGVRSLAADLFEFHIKAHGFTGWKREHRFALEAFNRAWRFDFAHTGLRLAVEIDGLVVRKIGTETVCTGRHVSIDGFREDCRKKADAVELGWHVLVFEASMVKNGEAIATLARVLMRRGIVNAQSTAYATEGLVAAPAVVPRSLPQRSRSHGRRAGTL